MADEESSDNSNGERDFDRETPGSNDEAGQFDPTETMARDEILDTFAELGAAGKESTSHIDPDVLRRFLESEKAEKALREKPSGDDEGSATVSLDLDALSEFLDEYDETPGAGRDRPATHNLNPREVQYIIEGKVDREEEFEESGAVSLDKQAVRQFMSLDSTTGEEDTGETTGGLGSSDVHHLDPRDAREEIERKQEERSDESAESSKLDPALEINRKMRGSYRASPADGSTDRVSMSSGEDAGGTSVVRTVVILAAAGVVVGLTAGYVYRSGVWKSEEADDPSSGSQTGEPVAERASEPGVVGDRQGGAEAPTVEPRQAVAGDDSEGDKSIETGTDDGRPADGVSASPGDVAVPDARSASASADESNEGKSVDDERSDDENTGNDRVEIEDRVHFRVESTKLHTDSRAILDRLVDTLTDHPEISTIRVEGHSDSRGTDEVNQRLSRIRAQRVKRYLVDQGIDSDRIETAAYGHEKPVASNDSKQGRARNRRVEIFTVGTDGAAENAPDAASRDGQ